MASANVTQTLALHNTNNVNELIRTVQVLDDNLKLGIQDMNTIITNTGAISESLVLMTASIVSMTGSISTIETKQTNLTTDVGAVDDVVDRMEVQLGTNSSADVVGTGLCLEMEILDDKMDQLDGVADRIEERVGTLATTTAASTGLFSEMEKLEARVGTPATATAVGTGLFSEIEKLEVRVGTLATSTAVGTGLFLEIEKLDSVVKPLVTTVNSIATTVNALTTTVTNGVTLLNNGIMNLSSKVDTLINAPAVNPHTVGTIQYHNWEQTGDGDTGYVNIQVSYTNTDYAYWELFMIANGSGYVGDPSQTGLGNTDADWSSYAVNFSDNEISPDEHVFKITTTDGGVSWAFENTVHTTVSFVYAEATSVKYEITRVGISDLWSIKKHGGTSYLTVFDSSQNAYAGGAYTEQYGYYGMNAALGVSGAINEQQKFLFHYIPTTEPDTLIAV